MNRGNPRCNHTYYVCGVPWNCDRSHKSHGGWGWNTCMKYRLRLPEESYGCVYADPPWLLKTGGAMRKLQYDTMTTEEIANMGELLTAPGVLQENAHLWLWTTNPHLPEAFDIINAWGFVYKSMMTWDKRRIGIGWWLRSRTEHILFCVRDSDTRSYRIMPGGTSTLLSAPYRGHSHKPEEMYPIIEKLSPGPYLELFPRGDIEDRENWTFMRSELGPTGDPYGTGYTPDGACQGCPHDKHPANECGRWAVELNALCPCGYDIDIGPDQNLEEYGEGGGI